MRDAQVIWRLLLLACFVVGMSTPAAADQVVLEIQQRLLDLGHDPGAVDGVSGRKTRDAIAQMALDKSTAVSDDPALIVETLRRLDAPNYFLPADFGYTDETSIASGGTNQDQFQEWLALIPARKSMLLYDTCDSGSLINGVASRGLEEVAALARMTRAMGRTVLSASTDDAAALEGFRGHGVFTYALLQALGDGDANSVGTIEVTELASAIDKAVPEISFNAFAMRQIPQMSIIRSNFLMAVMTALLSDGPVVEVIPKAPTHVLVLAAEFRLEATDASPGAGALDAATVVRVLAEDGE